MLQGEFVAHGYKVSRERILRSLHRVDEEGCQRRKHRCLRRFTYGTDYFYFITYVLFRRVYSVPYALALVHLDGHHKLCPRFHLVIHAAIDGFSR